MKRVGLTQRVEVVASYGERRDCLDQRWASLLLSLGFCPVPLANDVQDVEGYLGALSLDGVILTGGNDIVEAAGSTDVTPERDRLEHLVLDIAAVNRLPVLGVCRGLQMMNVHYGGGLVRVDGHVAQAHSTRFDTAFFPGCLDSTVTNSFHGYGIDESCFSPKLRAVAWAEDGTIEAAVHESLPNIGIMWHPEREESLTQHDQLMIQTAFGDGQS
jgi:putative glutamine amidotransferase